MHRLLILCSLLFGPPALARDEAVDQALPKQDPMEELFADKCASCHSIGKGDRVGPDLKGAHERRDPAWLARMIREPSAVLDSDPVARDLVKKYNNVRMPDLGLTDEQIAGLVALIERCSSQPCNLAGLFVPITQAKPGDVERGRALFSGAESLKNGGPPCATCHVARGLGTPFGGGTLARDLTHAFARLGDEGLDSALRNPAFPFMKDIYANNRSLEKDEVFALRAFLSHSNRVQGAAEDSLSLLFVGFLGAVTALVLLNLFWSRRLRGIRKSLTHLQEGAK